MAWGSSRRHSRDNEEMVVAPSTHDLMIAVFVEHMDFNAGYVGGYASAAIMRVAPESLISVR